MIEITGIKTKRTYYIDENQIDAIHCVGSNSSIIMKENFQGCEIYEVSETGLMIKLKIDREKRC